MALVFYLHYEAPPDEQNFPMVMDMIRAGDVKEDNEEYVSTLDELLEELRGQGIGRVLFAAAARWAAEQGGQKLYISAHSAVESQAFYKRMGCVEAEEYDPAHTAAEPCDCQMECALTTAD